MPPPLSDDERQAILDLLPTGKSCRAIATQVGRSPDTVSRIAQTVGHRFGHTNAARAHEASRGYGSERRAHIAARLTDEVEQLLDGLHGKYLVFNFGGRDNTYEEHELAEPPVEAKDTLLRAVQRAMRTVLDIDRHDNRNDEGLAAVDQWLREIAGAGAGEAA